MVKLLNYIIVFFLVILFIVIVLTIYNILKPNYVNLDLNPAFFFQPYPQISIKDIPDNNIDDTSKSCYKFLTKCDPKIPNPCSSCTSDFICTTVDESNNSNIVLNGNLVPKGNWCLPKLPANDKCNSFTGRWIWSNNEECQNDKSSTQCWKCECLYPDLFSGRDCSTQLACKAVKTNVDTLVGQEGNILRSTSFNPKVPVGTQWNPSLTNLTDDEKKVLIEQSPYDSDGKSNPYFECDCQGPSCKKPEDCEILGPLRDDQRWTCDNGLCKKCTIIDNDCVNDQTENPFVKLPNDPYMCHVNPCSPYNANHFASLIKTKDFKCECSNDFININNNFGATKENNDLYGTCILKNDIPCPFNITDKECICESGYNRLCRSKYANKNQQFPDCIDQNNPIGFECYDPCPSENCNYRGIVEYIGTCSGNQSKQCQSNSDCIGSGTCIYKDTCTCKCLSLGNDTCSVITKKYKNKNPLGKPDNTMLENVCSKYSEICTYNKDKASCDKKEIKPPFKECNNMSFSGDKCELTRCDDTSVISFPIETKSEGTSTLTRWDVNKDLIQYCDPKNKQSINELIDRKGFNKQLSCVTNLITSNDCIINCSGKS